MYSQTVMTLSLAIGKFNVLTNSDDFEFGNR